MSVEMIITLVALGVTAISGIVGLIVAISRGDLKKFIEDKMVEAEELYADLPKPDSSKKKLEYVLKSVKENYKLATLFLNVKKFIEYIITISKQINHK